VACSTRIRNVAKYNVILCLQGGAPGINGPGIYYDNHDNGLIGVANLYASGLIGTGTITNGVYASAAGIANNGLSSIWINGALSSSGSLVTGDSTGVPNIYIVGDSSTSPITGYVAEGIYYGRALSAGEIATFRTSHQSYYGTP
jgi:hypothetical protein